MKQFILETLRYPPEALKAKKEGVVRIRIAINFKGKVVDTQLLSRLGYGCDEEADRLVRLMPWEIDKKIRKGKVLFHKTLNIHFKLPKRLKTPVKIKTQKKEPLTQYSYNIVPPTKTTGPTKPATISYTIKY